jgi:cysteine desulfuration protein SufE
MIEEKVTDLKNKFNRFDDWMGKYQYVIALGKKQNGFNEEWRIDDNEVRGCQSKVWLVTEKVDDNLKFYSDSDSAITKGISYLLSYVYSDEKPEDIIEHQPTFVKEIGLVDALSPTRQNGLKSMILKIKSFASQQYLENLPKPIS